MLYQLFIKEKGMWRLYGAGKLDYIFELMKDDLQTYKRCVAHYQVVLSYHQVNPKDNPLIYCRSCKRAVPYETFVSPASHDILQGKGLLIECACKRCQQTVKVPHYERMNQENIEAMELARKDKKCYN